MAVLNDSPIPEDLPDRRAQSLRAVDDNQPGELRVETALRRVWGFACKRVGVQCSIYEGTKHSLGTALKAAGVEDRVIQQLDLVRAARRVFFKCPLCSKRAAIA